ncbi:phage tail protein [Hymenobacter canadensis]|uniref:Phage tail protein n=1 Tax=Hymenobacter canadensis TaxID=2999067 RepID=A0ABY7LUD3_9BACT|nr:phage tail protein [Hymenobacter canadensis]WBA44012.1 phage tail protein [Hymenobacter canadensis]
MADTLPLPRFYFQLELEGEPADVEAAFQEMSGILLEQPEQEQPSLSGQDQYLPRLPARAGYSNLVLRRGLVSRDATLAAWCLTTLAGSFTSPIVARNVSLRLLDEAGNPLASWLFTQAWPVKWSTSELELPQMVLAVETLELAYSTCQRV